MWLQKELMHSQAVNRPDLRSTISRLEEAEDDISRSERLMEIASGGWFPAVRQVRRFVFGEGMAEAAVPDAYPVEFDRAALPEGFPYRVKLVRHPARNRTRSWAGFPHGYVIVLDGRQPTCVLCLALRKSRSKPKSAF